MARVYRYEKVLRFYRLRQRKAVHLIILPVRAYLEELKMRCSIMQIGLG